MAIQGLIGFHLIYKMPNHHFIFRLITEDSDIHLIAKSLAFQELRLLNQCPNFVQTFFYAAQAALCPRPCGLPLSFGCAEIHLVTHWLPPARNASLEHFVVRLCV
jgi:hypothetical protein